jgi:ribosome-associated protein
MAKEPSVLQITPQIALPDEELEWQAIRAQGAGGQNVNKVSSALHLRFDVRASSLPDAVKQRLLAMRDHRISSDGIVIIKAQRFRTQEKNRADAVQRLGALIASAAHEPKRRQATRPTLASKQRRLEGKTRRGLTKRLRGRVED